MNDAQADIDDKAATQPTEAQQASASPQPVESQQAPAATQPVGAQQASATEQPAEAEQPHMKGKVANLVLCGVAFAVLLIFLFVAGEANDMAEAVANMKWGWLALSVCLVVLYWVLESTCMQIFADQMWPGFSFLKTNVVTVIGQYFNCITPLSSGGQPFQAYYYSRYGMPLSKSMPMLLCRFISYQLATTLYCAIVLVARFSYFSTAYSGLMVLVVIGFIGGLGLMTFLLLLAFWKRGTMRATRAVIRLGYRLHIVKDLSSTVEKATASIEDAYREVRFLVHEPKLLLKASGVTFIQLTEYFAISYVIYRGFGFDSVDFLTIISCQAFVYMISSFVPTPGAMGAAEGSYALFFSSIYPSATYVALSTFIWRLLTFYFPIIVGMITTLVVNHNAGAVKKPAASAEGGTKTARHKVHASKRSASSENDAVQQDAASKDTAHQDAASKQAGTARKHAPSEHFAHLKDKAQDRRQSRKHEEKGLESSSTAIMVVAAIDDVHHDEAEEPASVEEPRE